MPLVSGGGPSLKVGDKVRVKTNVTTPKYKWGSVTHRSVGTVTGESTLQTNTNLLYLCISSSMRGFTENKVKKICQEVNCVTMV